MTLLESKNKSIFPVVKKLEEIFRPFFQMFSFLTQRFWLPTLLKGCAALSVPPS
jgi:hypothetical protein